MHTIVVVAVGFGLLGMCNLAGRVLGATPGIAMAAPIFLPLWLVAPSINKSMGVKGAGYSVADEAPIFLLVFLVPAVAALIVWWNLR
jgi:hypothetical protein